MLLNIAVLPGDGIGPEIINEALKVLKVIEKKYNHTFKFTEGQIGAVAIRKTGKPFPEETFQLCENSDAILFGAVGDPEFDNNPVVTIRPEQGLLEMRKKLGLYANVRPIITFKALVNKSPLKKEIIENVNFVIVRELTGGIYFGELRGRTEDGTKAFDTNVYSKDEILRISKFAFEIAKTRRKKLSVVDKANVLATSRLWRETIQSMESEYPDIEVEYLYVDNAAMQIIQYPSKFDVIVTENMFGDILSDEASVITGSLGMLPSASIGISTALFEPIHGSYPQAAGKNIANPIATILSAAMLLEYNGLIVEANDIKKAVEASLENNIVTKDLAFDENYCSTSEVGDWIANYI